MAGAEDCYEEDDDVGAWLNLQAFLAASGNISKILWPPRSDRKSRGRQVRQKLHVPEDSSLKDRRLRDHLEHFDERIDEFFDAYGSELFMDRVLGKDQASYFEGIISSSQVLRFYDPDDRLVVLRGETFELAPLLHSIGTLKEAATDYVRRYA